MATRWALVGLMTLAALGCSGSENGRYQTIPGQDMGSGGALVVLDTREGRLCVAAVEPKVEQAFAQKGVLCARPRPLPKGDTLPNPRR